MIVLRWVFLSHLWVTCVYGSDPQKGSGDPGPQPSFQRQICADAIERLNLKPEILEGIPQVRTKVVRELKGLGSGRKLKMVLQLDMYADDPVLLIYFIPREVKPAPGLKGLIDQVKKLSPPQASIEFLDDLGLDEELLIFVKLPLEEDFEGHLMDLNLATASLNVLVNFVSPETLIDLENLRGEIARDIRIFIATQIRNHFRALGAQDLIEAKRIIDLLKSNESEGLTDDDEELLMNSLLDPDTIALFSALLSDKILHDCGHFNFPELDAKGVSRGAESLVEVQSALGIYITQLLASERVKQAFRSEFSNHPQLKALLGDDFELVELLTFFDEDMILKQRWWMSFSLRIRIKDNPREDDVIEAKLDSGDSSIQ